MRDDQMGNQQDADSFFGGFREVLSAAVIGGHSDWEHLLRNNPQETGGLSNSARARVIHDRTVHRLAVAEASGAYPGLRVVKIRGLSVVILGDAVMLKLKKLDVTLRSRNIRTGQTTAFDRQMPLLGQAYGSVTNATSGYVLDELGSEIVRIVAVCWEGPDKRWEVNLMEATGEGDGTVVTIPVGPAPPTPSRTRVVAEKPAASVESPAE